MVNRSFDRPELADSLESQSTITRRKLLTGVAITAPVVLTLRSGAVMAAGSCTGAMVDVQPTSTSDICVPKSYLGYNGCPDYKIPTQNSKSGAYQAIAQPGATNVFTCDKYDSAGLFVENGVMISSTAFLSLT